jgi:hypothetical protein
LRESECRRSPTAVFNLTIAFRQNGANIHLGNTVLSSNSGRIPWLTLRFQGQYGR